MSPVLDKEAASIVVEDFHLPVARSVRLGEQSWVSNDCIDRRTVELSNDLGKSHTHAYRLRFWSQGNNAAHSY